ncbi:hypothetical protein PHYSODRAFT_254224 [Phytophthora sojae]|uniref:Peptidase S33 tripeptidyl aminopeptidase-like C-terminal domain-containing protein n=1 Tax=Phytophthora sojae (strain P6497) TaxID=1094619 RepID=G5A924_PHYSP|nr:hypothetical protein PHYSODRAFT_254224 [Phytophthora sojae]EGZ08400.1 hypothetical protein PHYSODRAFT_254224 [Phytophthora sojae]|eukprot:XP_009536572.1 hypothetical protein PHYSODRAFT_254224 [Phytophthora sojae]
MWEIPGPSVDEMNARVASTKLSDGSVYKQASVYYAFSKEKSQWCNDLGVGNYDANAIMYEHDQYWNKTVAIPSHASVLLLSSKMDAKTPHKYAEYLLDALEGDNKELVTFNYTVHGSVVWTFLVDNDYSSKTCGMEIFESFINNAGDLKRLEKSCLEKMPPLNLTPPTYEQYTFLGTADAYEGGYNSSLRHMYK